MKNELSCEVVQDLLPSYLEDLTSDITSQAIEAHIENCEQCKETCSRMKESYEFHGDNQKKDIDFLKRARERARIRNILGLMTGIAIVAVIVIINAFFIGRRVDNSDLIHTELRVTNNHIALSGNLMDSGKGVAEVQFDNKDGIVKISVYATLKSTFHKNSFYSDYDSDKVISQIWVGDRIVWDNGDPIDEEVAKLYETRHLYIGDMPANGDSASALGIWKDIGNYTNELQTTKEPYGWSLIGEQDYAEESKAKIEAQMRSYGSALIAVIDNLGYVTFKYSVNGKDCTLTITEKDADAMAGQSVKGLAKTPCGLQQLMKILNLSRGYIGSRMESYVQKSDGKWLCDGNTYKYRTVLTGRDPAATADGRIVVLTNNADITYQEVSKMMFGSNSEEWPERSETIIVEIGGN